MNKDVLRKIFSLIIAASMSAGTLPVIAHAEAGDIIDISPDNYSSTIDDDNNDSTYENYSSWCETDKAYGTFPVADIKNGGKFRVEYTGDYALIVLAMSDYGSGSKGWIVVEPEAEGTTDEGFYAEYSYDDVKSAWGESFTDLKALSAATWGVYNEGTKVSIINKICWVEGDDVPQASETPAVSTEITLSSDMAFMGKQIAVDNPVDGAAYKWYRSSTPEKNGVEIEGADGETYTVNEKDLGMYIYCENGTDISKSIPVAMTEDMVTTSLFKGNVKADSSNLAAPIFLSQTGYKFTSSMIMPGGKFKVEFDGDSDIKLCLSNWSTGKWAEVESVVNGNSAEFDYEAIKAAYGEDFSDLDSLQIKTADSETSITSIEYAGYNTGEIMHIKPWSADGLKTAVDSQTNIGYAYMKHTGGDFDTAKMRENGYLYFTYEGDMENKLYLSFTSYSSGDETKAKSWVTIEPEEYGTIKDGVYWGKISVSELKENFGENFARLDHIGFYIKDNVTVNMNTARLYYVDGTGAYVEQNPTDTKWTNKTHKDGGIAFIGDSICHNPICNSDVGLTPDKGDWNAILGRTDCDNYGIGGETSAHIMNRFYQLLDTDCNYRQIVTLFGINDVGLEANDEMVIQRIMANYTKVFDMVAASDKKPVDGMYVISLLPTTPMTYEGAQERIAKVNEQLKALCEKYDFITFVNAYDKLLYTGSETLDGCTTPGEPHGDPKYFMADGLHPIALGYKEIATVLNPILGGDYSESSGLSGTAVSWDFNDGAEGWTYGGADWSNSGTTEGSMNVSDGKIKIDVQYSSTTWSQCAVTNWSDSGIDISGKNLAAVDVMLEKAAADKAGGTMLMELYGTNKDDNSRVLKSTVKIPTSSKDIVSVAGKEYYRTELNIGFTESEKPVNNIALMIVGKNTKFDGSILIDNISLQKKTNDTAVAITSEKAFLTQDGNTDIDLTKGSASIKRLSNGGRCGRLFDGAKITAQLKKGNTAVFNGTALVRAVIEDTEGKVDKTGVYELSAESFDENGTVNIEIPYDAVTTENVRYISFEFEKVSEDCNYNDTLTLVSAEMENGAAKVTSPYSEGTSSGGGAGSITTISIPYTWHFANDDEGWKYGKGWENDYSGAKNSSVGMKNKMLNMIVDYSKDKDKSWSQMAITLWNNNGMNFIGANHASVKFCYDPTIFDGSFKLKLYSNCGIDAMSSINTQKAVDINVEGKTYKQVKAEFTYPTVTNSYVQDLALCIIGQNTSYKGEIYLSEFTVDKGKDIYVNSTKKAVADNSTLKLSGKTVETAENEKVDVVSDITLVDGKADESVRDVYAYLKAIGESKDVLFGQQNNIHSKAGSKSLSDSDTFDVTGDYSAVCGIDTLELTGNQYSAEKCNEQFGTNFAHTAAGNVQTAAYLSNKIISNGAIVTLSAHMPNFAGVEKKNTNESQSYAKYDFSGYTPNMLTGDTANEILPGGKYNEVYMAYLDMIADYAGQVNGAVLFRPFHENTGSWFWWGKAYCDAETYKNIYRYTVEYLRDEKNVHNFMYLYGPSGNASGVEEYAERYPGDEYIDMVGFDMYDNDPDVNSTWMLDFKKQLEIANEFAKVHNKLVTVAETGATNVTQDGDNQTALLHSGNKDKDWYNRVLDIVSESDAAYFLLWANFSESDGFYTPYVVKKNSDGTLYGHEMLDNFIDFYNDKRSVFAGDQKAALSAISGVSAKAVTADAQGYITAPISGRRVYEPTKFTARVTNGKEAEVKFVLTGTGKTVTLNAVSTDGLNYNAQLNEDELKSIGASPDGYAELIVNGTSHQKIKLIYNIVPPVNDPELIDDFNNYYGVNALMTKEWTVNSASGSTIDIELSDSVKYEGAAAMKADYSLAKGGYAGAVKSKDTDWSGCDAIELWMLPDGKNQKAVIQISANNKVYEVYLDDYAEYKDCTSAILITIPFSEFVSRDEKDHPKGGFVNDSKAVTSCGLWIDAVENSSMENGTVSGTVYYDNIRAVKNGGDSVKIVKADNVGFADVKSGAWYYDAVMYVYGKGIMNGTGGNMFEPENTMTRAQAAQVFYNIEGKPESGENTFADIAENAWYNKAVAWAAEKGIVTGYDAAHFGADDKVTREQLAVILMRYAQFKGADIKADGDISIYSDSGNVSTWAAESMKQANAEGLINGMDNNRLEPQGNATRAQFAAIMQRYCENYAE